MAVYVDDMIPGIKYNGLVLANSTCSLPSTTTIGGSTVSALGVVTSSSANALSVGLTGSTNPQFNVDASTSTASTGINVKGAAAAGGVAVTAISSGTDENLTLDAKGAGTVTINGTATGGVTLGRATTVTTGDVTITSGNIIVTAINKGISFTATGTSGGVLTNLWNSASTALSGTQKDIKILIGTVPFYFTTYQVKA